MSRARAWAALALAASLASPSLAAAQAARAPYLQSPTERSIDVVWRTSAPSTDRVCWGPSGGALDRAAGAGTSGTDHAVRVAGLSPDTAYDYVAGAAACPPPAGTAPDGRFRTAPPRGATTPYRLWVLGDSGTGGTAQAQVRDAMLGASADRAPDLMLHLGDMAYDTGTTAEFDGRFFAVYASILRRTPVWPTMGNHEGTSSNSSTQTGPYYDAYVLPSDGRAGGLMSGTEAYYAFDWGPVHFVVLDSHESPRSPTGAMLRWLDADLAATDQPWIVAFFHHPPYTHGTHNSETESQLVEMRQNALPILEAHGVDLVLAGHSHIYERSHLVHGAYDTPTTAAGHIVDPGDGRIDGDGAYQSGAAGALYVVAGHGGASLGGTADHPLMFVSEVRYGSCLVDVTGDSMTLRNVRSDGVVSDHVTLSKREGLFLERPVGGEVERAGGSVDVVWSTIGAVASVRIEASLDGGATWGVVADRTANDGREVWMAPAVETTRARIRISDADAPGRGDESADFTLSSRRVDEVIAFGATWQYSDRGMDLGDAWREGEGGAWPEGPGELGYGDGDEATVLHDATPNVPTVYFRRRIDLSDDVVSARLRAVFDDGIVVWVNGVEVTRANVDALDFAAWSTTGATAEQTFDRTLDLTAANPFRRGENWIAAVVKQSSATSSDVSFDLALELGLVTPPPPAVDAGAPTGDAGASRGDGGASPEDGGASVGDAGTDRTLSGGCGCAAAGRGRGEGGLVLVAVATIVAARRRRRRGARTEPAFRAGR